MISKKDYYFKLYLAEVDKEYDEYLDRFYKDTKQYREEK